MNFERELVEFQVLSRARCSDRIRFKQNGSINLIREEKADRAYVCADIHQQTTSEMSTQELDVH